MKSDAELMLDYKSGSQEAFEKIVMRHQMSLFNFFMRLTHDTATSEDLTQEVFMKIYLHSASYVTTAKFTTYMYRIAKNCWIDLVRKNARRGSMDSLNREIADGISLIDTLESKHEMPEERIESQGKAEIINEALEALPEDQRLVFVLSEVQGMKYAEISETLEIPVGTVKSRMHVAVRRLRDHLERHGLV